ncbi:unnamed protein product [Dovyalis caffra]|uniref:Thioesterase domain-containing protein n=1 Tax=Dovyalis caffra TaxID=77055 RepID=A0AAV1SAP9_9ROSI|nr:unnamed protein product [Dovyalis caffra]
MTESSSSSSSTTTFSKDLPSEYAFEVKSFFGRVGIHASLPQKSTSKDFYSDLIRDLLKADHVRRGHITCIVPVLPVVGNKYNGLHGGAVGAIAERVSVACARTVVADDKELFLGTEIARFHLYLRIQYAAWPTAMTLSNDEASGGGCGLAFGMWSCGSYLRLMALERVTTPANSVMAGVQICKNWKYLDIKSAGK